MLNAIDITCHLNSRHFQFQETVQLSRMDDVDVRIKVCEIAPSRLLESVGPVGLFGEEAEFIRRNGHHQSTT